MDDKMQDTLVATCLVGLVQRHGEGTRLGDFVVARGHWCGEVWGMSGHLFGPKGHDHRDKLLCGICLLMEFARGHEQH